MREAAKPDFKVALEKMRAHHLSRKGGDFFEAHPQFQSLNVTNAPATVPPVADDAQTTKNILEPVNQELASKQQEVADAVKTGTTNAANDLKTSQNQVDFKAKLAAQRQKALQDSDANINAAFDKAGQLGDAQPELQGGILVGMNVVQNIINRFTTFISQWVDKVESFIKDILAQIMGAFTKALDDFASEARSLLSSIF